ncbi:MAG: SWIM zinc finger family protein [Acetobacteraceae bacterium]|nr:SWIM zinc finger family protein [Acetobacteraceae bacterium]
MMKLARKGQDISPVRVTGRKIASTFWGTAWCDNLEGYRDFENRLPRGRTYVRNGSVLDLQISRCEVRAMVSGSSLYHVSISIDVLPNARWRSICRDCAGGIDSVIELLQGQLSKSGMERVCEPGKGLFPQPSEITFTCSCPDYAFMCKHVAAVLYGVGARLDQQPELLFTLRAVDQTELIGNFDSGLLSKAVPNAVEVLADDDISALFGLDMADDTPSWTTSATTKATRSKSTRSKRAKSSRGIAQPECAMPSSAVAALPKRRTAKTAVPVLPKSIEKPSAPRNAPAQLASMANRRGTVADSKRANGAVPMPGSAAKAPANTAARGKSSRAATSPRLRRTARPASQERRKSPAPR